MISFLVYAGGFGLEETRNLYLDEFFEYYEETVFHLEQEGKIEKGNYRKMAGIDTGESTVDKLRKQLYG